MYDSPYYYRYLYSFYYSITTMVTVGYGDITPTNVVEICYSMLFMLVCCGMFCYSINRIGIILTQINEKS